MSLNRYNLTPYNRKLVKTIENSAMYTMYANVTALVSVDVLLVISYRCHETLEGTADLQYFHNEQYELEQGIEVSVLPTVYHLWKGELSAELTGEANMPVFVSYRMTDGIDASAPLRLEVILAANLFALLSAAIDSLITSEEVMRFEGMTIKPGQSLVIDSETFTVLLSGKDAIEQYSGVWPWFDKRLEGVTVESMSGGNAQVSILYRERYL